MALKRKRQLANQLTQRINEVKEDQLRIAVSEFFRKQRNLVLAAFDEYYLEEMLLQGHIDLILAPIHELQKEYYELLLEHNRDMFRRGEAQAERLVDNAKRQYSMKAKKTVDFLHDNENKYTQHFGTLQFSEDYLENYTFTATEKTSAGGYIVPPGVNMKIRRDDFINRTVIRTVIHVDNGPRDSGGGFSGGGHFSGGHSGHSGKF